MSKTNTLVIRTPEGILFSQLLAGPVTRFLAWFIDLFVIVALVWAVNFAVLVLVLISPDLAQAFSILLMFVVSVGYGIATEWFWRGQTLGKRILRLRVVDAEGLRLQVSQIILRNLLRFVDMLPLTYLVGGVACVLSRRAQRLGDLAANTVVIRIPKIQEPDLSQVLVGKYNSFRAYPHLEARLRQCISPAEASLIVQGLMRRDALDPHTRVDLFHHFAEHCRAKVKFPDDATDGLTDEQYLRNVLDVVYRKQNRA